MIFLLFVPKIAILCLLIPENTVARFPKEFVIKSHWK